MPPNSYDEIANKTIRDFINAVVLIDDHWREAEDAPPGEIDPQKINLEPAAIPPQNSTDPVEEVTNEIDNAASQTLQTDPAYLREIGKEISNQGFLFTGFAYTDPKAKIALRLASKCDVLILDWNLGSGNCTPSLELLTALKDSGTPRFVFILTDESKLDGIRQKISAHLGEETTGTGLVFDCGPFSFSLKNKPQTGGENTVQPENVLNEAVAGIQNRFDGLLQLAALELLGQYRNSLHGVLDQFHADTDLPFVLEWLEQDSPIRDSHSFNALAIDEWSAIVTQRFSASESQMINDDVVSALLAKWKESTNLPKEYEAGLKAYAKAHEIKFPTAREKIDELVTSLEEWMALSLARWPKILKGAKKNEAWGKGNRRIFALIHLVLKKEKSSPGEVLKKLDSLFQCQANLPLQLQQGTVLLEPTGTYLICVTTSCDCDRPTRVKNRYSFLEAHNVTPEDLNTYPEALVVAIRTQEDSHLLLAVSPKPTLTYKIHTPG